MDRRTFLATSAATVGVVTAGCSSVLGGDPVTLSAPESGSNDEGREKYLTYRHEGDRIVTLGFDQRDHLDSLTDRFGFHISVSHSDDTKIESFQFDLRAPRTSIDPPADIYLKSPAGGLWPDLTYEDIENRWTRIALPDTNELGEGTLNLETIVDPNSVPAENVGIRVDMTLSTTGSGNTRYRLVAGTSFYPVVG